MNEMVTVIALYNGQIFVEETKPNMATQHLYCYRNGINGEAYICKKEMVDYYKKKLINNIIKNQEKRVKEEQDKLQKLLDIKWDV